ncbi:hypothetical protein [Providencia hangzhouensis]|uniref:hypothetical protein n=1 Tax=Providencia hangzhouensis TaxID=3031799 RepID=UPI0039F4F59E
MNTDLWIGLSAAIPLAIAATYLQRWIDNGTSRLKKVKIEKKLKSKKKQLASLKEELNKITLHRNATFEFSQYVLISLIRIVLYCSFTFITVSFLRIIPIYIEPINHFIILICSVFIFRTCNSILEMYSKITNYEKYKKTTEKLIAEIEKEIHHQ